MKALHESNLRSSFNDAVFIEFTRMVVNSIGTGPSYLVVGRDEGGGGGGEEGFHTLSIKFHLRKLKLGGLIAYFMFYKIC